MMGQGQGFNQQIANMARQLGQQNAPQMQPGTVAGQGQGADTEDKLKKALGV